jgi:hypothetical protein
MRPSFFVVYLVFPHYTTAPFRAELTPAQARRIAASLEKRKKAGAILDYYVGPPPQMEWTNAMILSSDALQRELDDLIEMELRLSRNR